jgi:hypothetical protein
MFNEKSGAGGQSYGLRYFGGAKSDEDPDMNGDDESDQFDLNSCANDCCDSDCNYDDCLRCGTEETRRDDEDYLDLLPIAA